MADPLQNTALNRREIAAAFGSAVISASVPSQVRAASAPAILIRNGYVLTLDASRGDVPNGDVLVRDGRISDVGANLQPPDGAEVIDASGMVVLPGFVDAHTHGSISQMRGLYGNAPETAFFTLTNRLAAHYAPEDTFVGMHLSAVESVNSGITTTADFFDSLRNRDHAEAGLKALREAPIRGCLLYGMKSKTTADSIDLRHLEEWHAGWSARSDGGRVSLGLAWRLPSALDDASAWAIKMREWETARRLQLPVQVHVSGTKPGSAEAMFDALISRKLLFPGLQVIHATDARPDQLAALEEAAAGLVVTPVTEHRVGYGLTRIDRFSGVSRLGFGIDGSALAGSTDMFGLMRLAALTQSGASRSEVSVQPRRLLELATMGGARALGLADRVGSLTVGKQADLQIIGLDELNLAGFAGGEPSALIVYSGQPSDVRLVMVDGRVVKRDGRLVGIDLPDLTARARRSVKAVGERAS